MKRFVWQDALLFGAFAIFLCACQQHVSDRSPMKAVAMEREVFLSGITGQPTAVTLAQNGNLVIAGLGDNAWAIGVNNQGKVLWRFDEPAPAGVPASAYSQISSAYQGAVSLDNGNVLLCGNTASNSATNPLGLLTVLDSAGAVVEERRIQPKDDLKFFTSRFYACVRVEDGIVVLGAPINGRDGYLWFVKLDTAGKEVWQGISTELAGANVVEARDGNLIFASSASGTNAARLFRVSSGLNIIAQRSIAGSTGYAWLLETQPQDVHRLVVYKGSAGAVLYSVSDTLADVTDPAPLRSITIDQGVGYVLPDHSLALFGYTQSGGGAFTRPYTAAVAWATPAGHEKSVRRFAPEYASFTVRAATPMSNKEFVAIREVNDATSKKFGIALSWVRFQ